MRLLRDPLLWLILLYGALLVGLPYSAGLFSWLFPQLPRPLYQQESFWALTVAHFYLVGVSSLVAIVLGIGLGIVVTRPFGLEFRALVETSRRWARRFPRWRCWRWRYRRSASAKSQRLSH